MLADDRKVDLLRAPEVLVYGDTALPSRFYYAATRPAVARRGDGYQLSLMRYDKPVHGRVAQLSLVVDLRPTESVLALVRAELAERFPGTSPDLQPIPWTDGTVAAALQGGPTVLGTPSLLGENSAVLSFGLTTEEYLRLRPASGSLLPSLCVVYGLSYEVMRKAWNFSVRFNGEKFREWVQHKCSFDFLFLHVETGETFEELRQFGALEVVNENHVAEEAPEGFRVAFMRSLQSALTPLPHFTDADSGSNDGWRVGFACEELRDVQRISRVLDTRMAIAGVTTRKACIQGLVADWEEALAAQPDKVLPTGLSFVQTLQVRCHENFATGPVGAATVQIQQTGQTVLSHVFTDNASEWSVQLTRPPGTESTYQARCVFNTPSAWGPHPTAQLPIARDQAFLDIIPAAFYSRRRYRVSVAEDFPWPLVRFVRLQMRGPAGLGFQPEQLTLQAGDTEACIEAFAPHAVDLDGVEFIAQLHKHNDLQPLQLTGLPAGPSIFLNPVSCRVVRFRVAPDFDWQEVLKVVVRARPAPDGSQLWESTLLTLTPQTAHGRLVYWFSSTRPFDYSADFVRRPGLAPLRLTATAVASDLVLQPLAQAS